MRLVPIITAVLVTITLYLAVFERDKLLAFARGDTQEQIAATEDATSQDAPKGNAPSNTQRVVGVVATHSKARTVDSAVILRGQTQAARQVQVRAETSAAVISDPLRKGAFVKAGETLCRLDPGTREAVREEAQARLAEAKSAVPAAHARVEEATSRLNEAKINDKVASKLIEDGYASETRVASTNAAVRAAEAAVETARSGLDSAQAAIQSAEAAIAAADREIDRLTIKAPFGGLLESDTAEMGSLLQPGALCGTVIQLDPIKLVGYVPEAEVDRVKVGARAGALLVTGRRVMGTVTFLGRTADPQTRTFAVEVTVPNTDLSIRAGQTAEIAIASAGANAHLLPQSALTLNNEGALGVRTVGANDIVKFATVEVIRDTPDGVWVTGLGKSADVIVVGQDFVVDGVKVAPTWREAAQ